MHVICWTKICSCLFYCFPVLIMDVLLWLAIGSWCPQNLGSCRANEQEELLPLPRKCLTQCTSTFYLSLHERR